MVTKQQRILLEARTRLEQERITGQQENTWTESNEVNYLQQRMFLKSIQEQQEECDVEEEEVTPTPCYSSELTKRLQAPRSVYSLSSNDVIVEFLRDLSELICTTTQKNWEMARYGVSYENGTFQLRNKFDLLRPSEQCFCDPSIKTDDPAAFRYFYDDEELSFGDFNTMRGALRTGFYAAIDTEKDIDEDSPDFQQMLTNYSNCMNTYCQIVDTRKLCSVCHQNALGHWAGAKFVYKPTGYCVDWPELIGKLTCANRELGDEAIYEMMTACFNSVEGKASPLSETPRQETKTADGTSKSTEYQYISDYYGTVETVGTVSWIPVYKKNTEEVCNAALVQATEDLQKALDALTALDDTKKTVTVSSLMPKHSAIPIFGIDPNPLPTTTIS